MKRSASGQWLNSDNEPASGLRVSQAPQVAGAPATSKGQVAYVIDGWEVDAEAYRLWLYDREIDTREEMVESGGSSSQVLAALMEAAQKVTPAAPPTLGPPAPPPAAAPPAAAPKPPLPPPAPGERHFDR